MEIVKNNNNNNNNYYYYYLKNFSECLELNVSLDLVNKIANY